MPYSDPSILLPLSILSTGVILGLIGVVRHRIKISQLKRYVHAEGTVIRLEEVPAGEIAFGYNPVVSFTDHRKQKISFITEAMATKDSYSVGSILRVVYDPEDSSRAYIDQPSAKFLEERVWWFLAGLFILGGFIFLAVLQGWK